MENAGARMQKVLQDFPGSGLSALTRLMSLVSVVAAVVVALYAVVTIVLGTMSLMSASWSWTIGEKANGSQVVHARMSVAQVVPLPTAEKRLDMNCPELRKKTGGDISKCSWSPVAPGPEEVAAASKAKQTAGNWFNAAIRPVFWSMPVFLLAMGLVEAARCLNGLAGGRYFTADTVTYLRNFAVAGLLYVLLTPAMPWLANIFCNAIAYVNTVIVQIWPPRHPHIFSMPTYFEANAVVGGVKVFSGFLICLYAFTLAVIATVMAKASVIVEDHAEII